MGIRKTDGTSWDTPTTYSGKRKKTPKAMSPKEIKARRDKTLAMRAESKKKTQTKRKSGPR